MKNMIEHARQIIADQLGVDVEYVTDEKKIVDDLGADSFDSIELVMMIEEGFDIEISDEEAERINTVGEVYALLARLTGKGEYTPLPALKHKHMTMTLENGEVWGVPVAMIARNRAAHYAKEFDGNVERSLAEDTIPLFNSSDYDIHDWAVNNMNWSDFTGHQVKLKNGQGIDFQDEWMNAEKGLQ